MRNFDTLKIENRRNPQQNLLPLVAWILGILALSIIIGRPLFEGTLLDTHDSFLDLIRTICVKKAWLEGQIFPRWAPDMVFGYGYAILNFFPPVFHSLVCLISFVTKNIVEAQNLASFLIYFSSGISMFAFVSSLWGRPAGFLAAASYLFFPYHITDLYIRGAYAELTAFAILPFLLWSLKRLDDTLKIRHMLALTVGIALLSLSHNIMNILFVPWLLLLAVILIILRKRDKIEFAVKTAAAFFFGFGSASFFLLPAILEQKYVLIEKTSVGQYDYHQNFLTAQSLMNWIWHYKGPGQGPHQGIAFELGIIHVSLLLIALVLAIRHWKEKTTPKTFLIFFAAMALISIFMTTGWSSPVWDNLPFLKFVQFRWRFLVLIALAFSVLVGSCASGLKKYPAIAFITISVALLVMVNCAYGHPVSMKKLTLTNNTLDVRSIPPQENGEYLPTEFKRLLWPKSPNLADIWKGQGQIVEHRAITSIKHIFSIKALTPILVSFNTFYFPSWTIREKGQDISIMPDNPFGLIFFALPPGEHHLEISFQDTPIQKLATWLSLASLLGLFMLTILLIKAPWKARHETKVVDKKSSR